MIRSTVATMALVLLLAGCGDKPAAPEGAGEHAGEEHGNGESHEAGEESAGKDEHAEGEGEEGHEEGPPSTTMTDAVAKRSGVQVAPVTAGTIADQHEVQGLLTPVEGRIAQVMARFPGPIRSLRANVGDRVRAGQPLASIDSNLSLTTYGINAPISGVVLSRQAQVGGVAGEGQLLFEIGDLSQLWVDLHIFGADTQHITAGVPVSVTRMSDGISQSTTLERVLPGTATASQSTVARAVVDNADGLWRPGAAVRARIVVASTPADIVVPLTALQNMDGRDVVFVRKGDTYQMRPVTLGARDARQVAVSAGLQAGEEVVVEQSYTVKADIGKAGAGHEH